LIDRRHVQRQTNARGDCNGAPALASSDISIIVKVTARRTRLEAYYAHFLADLHNAIEAEDTPILGGTLATLKELHRLQNSTPAQM
jgi:hypothetical protein